MIIHQAQGNAGATLDCLKDGLKGRGPGAISKFNGITGASARRLQYATDAQMPQGPEVCSCSKSSSQTATADKVLLD